jgi:hypothetical protein
MAVNLLQCLAWASKTVSNHQQKNCKCFGFTGVEAGVNLVFGNALLDSNGGLHGFLVAS